MPNEREWVDAHVDAMISKQLESNLQRLGYPVTRGTSDYPLLARLEHEGLLDRFVGDFGMTLEDMESSQDESHEAGKS